MPSILLNALNGGLCEARGGSRGHLSVAGDRLSAWGSVLARHCSSAEEGWM